MQFKILIAEDEEITLNNLVETLRDEGYDVAGARDGIGAIQQLEREQYDVLITDIKMPDVTGIELLDRVKE